MDFGLAFSFPFKDADWFKKIGLVALVTLIPVIGQLVLLGWALEITRRVIDETATPLPELNFGQQLGKGFQVFLIGLVYAIPLILFMIPLIIVDAAGTRMLDSGNTGVGTALALLSVCCGGLIFLYSLVMAFLMPAAIGEFAAKGSLGAAFQFGKVFGLVRKAPVAYLVVVLGGLIAGFIAPLGTIACVIGVILTAAYASAAVAHLEGQAYNQAARPA